jgi:hypothetical protein
MWRQIVWKILTDVSEESAAYITRLEDWGSISSDTSVSIFQITWRHIPKDSRLILVTNAVRTPNFTQALIIFCDEAIQPSVHWSEELGIVKRRDLVPCLLSNLENRDRMFLRNFVKYPSDYTTSHPRSGRMLTNNEFGKVWGGMINWKHCNWIWLQGWSECTRNLKIIRLLVDIWPPGCQVGVILLRSSCYNYEYFRCNINEKIVIGKMCLNFFEGASQSNGKVDHYIMTTY